MNWHLGNCKSKPSAGLQKSCTDMLKKATVGKFDYMSKDALQAAKQLYMLMA
jgi:hypothetical protein